MEGVTAVDASWLVTLASGTSLLVQGAPLTDPEPSYDARKDVVMCTVRPLFGPKAWTLPLARVPASDPYPWFARLLLEGRVIGPLSLSPLAAPAAHVTKIPHLPRVVALVSTLRTARIGTLEALRSKVLCGGHDEGRGVFLLRELKEFWGVELNADAWTLLVGRGAGKSTTKRLSSAVA